MMTRKTNLTKAELTDFVQMISDMHGDITNIVDKLTRQEGWDVGVTPQMVYEVLNVTESLNELSRALVGILALRERQLNLEAALRGAKTLQGRGKGAPAVPSPVKRRIRVTSTAKPINQRKR